jgi:hypothetical protein
MKLAISGGSVIESFSADCMAPFPYSMPLVRLFLVPRGDRGLVCAEDKALND